MNVTAVIDSNITCLTTAPIQFKIRHILWVDSAPGLQGSRALHRACMGYQSTTFTASVEGHSQQGCRGPAGQQTGPKIYSMIRWVMGKNGQLRTNWMRKFILQNEYTGKA